MTTEAKQRIAAIRERVEVVRERGLLDVGPVSGRCARVETHELAYGDVPFLLDRIVVLEKLLERAAMFIDQHVSHGLENCKSGIDGSPCTCGKRAILAEIDSQFTRSDA